MEIYQLYEVNCAFNRKSHLGFGWNINIINYLFLSKTSSICLAYMQKNAKNLYCGTTLDLILKKTLFILET